MAAKLRLQRGVPLLLGLLSFLQARVLPQSDSKFDINASAREVEKHFQWCPRVERVNQWDSRYHQIWQKVIIGPPGDISIDVQENKESVPYQHIISVEFSLRSAEGRQWLSKADAEKDLGPFRPAAFQPVRYRNTYVAARNGIRLKTTEVLNRKTDGTNEWGVRPQVPGLCWDHIAEN